jgi:enamine deaminase RidA (YjgF/YER057c/UK114 family)
MRYVNPQTMGVPKGYNNGVLIRPSALGGVLFLAGQVAWDSENRIVSNRFADQFDQALANVIAVVTRAGGTTESIGSLTIYVTSLEEYTADREEIGRRYRARMGRHFPAMTLVEVKALLEPGAKIEIEGLACL